MKRIICLILTAVFSLSLYGNSYASAESSQAAIIDAKYKNLWPLGGTGTDETIAKVPLFQFQKGKYYGVINEKGKVVIDAAYDSIRNYQSGLVLVEKNKKFGLISNKGKVITKTKYDYIDSFHDGLASVRLGKKFGFINTSGKQVISIQYDDVFQFVDGIAPICTDGKWGLINKKGSYILKPKYAAIGHTFGDENEIKVSFADGIAPAEDTSGKWGYIDETGKEIIPPRFDAAHVSNNGFASFMKDNKMGLATIKGIVLEPTYDSIGDFDENGISCYCQNNKLGYINSDCKELTKAEYDVLASSSGSDSYIVSKDNKWGALNKNGSVIIEPQYDKMGSFYHGLAYVIINGKIGYINTGNELVIATSYSKLNESDSDFTFGTAIVNRKGKYGIIDTKGSFIVKPIYNLITKDIDNKLYIVKLGSKYGVLDSKGKVILRPDYSEIRINNNIICASKGSSAQLFSLSGKKLTKNSYEIMTFENRPLSDTCTSYIYRKNGKFGAIIVRTKS